MEKRLVWTENVLGHTPMCLVLGFTPLPVLKAANPMDLLAGTLRPALMLSLSALCHGVRQGSLLTCHLPRGIIGIVG